MAVGVVAAVVISGAAFYAGFAHPDTRPPGVNPLQDRTVTYTGSEEDFANPERGYADAVDPWWPQDRTGNEIPYDELPWDYCGAGNNFAAYAYTELTPALELTDLQESRERGISLVMVRYHIAAFRDSDLSQEFLGRLERDLSTARTAGVKVVLRLLYNYPKGGPDAPVERVVSHLTQVEPVLQDHADVIAFMDAGMIGCWGEWHHSSNELIDSDGTFNSRTFTILDKVLAVLPRTRMVTLRYPLSKVQYLRRDDPGAAQGNFVHPLTPAEAFTGSAKARLAAHDDCMVCGEFNLGTHEPDAQEAKTYLSRDNLFVVQSGEPGNPDTDEFPTDADGDGYGTGEQHSCARMMGTRDRPGLLPTMRFSTFNAVFDPAVPERWKREGCYDTIARNLGYRFALTDSQAPTEATRDGGLRLRFTIANRGWASPYNPRGLEIVLRHTGTGATHPITLTDGKGKPTDTTHDPRFWQPGSSTTVQVDQPLPAGIPDGQYAILLNLPDPEPALRNRPEYSIRMANQDVWEEETGYNDLRQTITIG
jgi:hypothetical protein